MDPVVPLHLLILRHIFQPQLVYQAVHGVILSAAYRLLITLKSLCRRNLLTVFQNGLE